METQEQRESEWDRNEQGEREGEIGKKWEKKQGETERKREK